MNVLVILNDPPYGTERTYNGLRLAVNLLSKTQDLALTVFLMGDAVAAAKTGQQTPNGYYNLERMVKGVVTRKGRVLLCGTCMDARGMTIGDVVEGSRRSTLDELTELTATAEKVLVF
ncbi:MAG: DsrE family protein [Acidobacteriota bacterium]